jgi:hypothetical protein
VTLVKFMPTAAGRFARLFAGIALIVGQLLGGAGLILSVVGLVALLAGALNSCLRRLPWAGPCGDASPWTIATTVSRATPSWKEVTNYEPGHHARA